MWLRHPRTGQVLLVHDEAHITRLVSEGGIEVEDPTIHKEIADGSTINDEQPDQPGPHDDRRSKRRKPAVR